MILTISHFLKIFKNLTLFFLTLNVTKFFHFMRFNWAPIFIKGLYANLINNSMLWKC